jgi:hypothetical protein
LTKSPVHVKIENKFERYERHAKEQLATTTPYYSLEGGLLVLSLSNNDLKRAPPGN